MKFVFGDKYTLCLHNYLTKNACKLIQYYLNGHVSSFLYIGVLFYDVFIILRCGKTVITNNEVHPNFWLVLYWCTWAQRVKPCRFIVRVYKLSSSFFSLFLSLSVLPRCLSFLLSVLYTQESFCLETRWKRQKPPLKIQHCMCVCVCVCVCERERERVSERERGREREREERERERDDRETEGREERDRERERDRESEL